MYLLKAMWIDNPSSRSLKKPLSFFSSLILSPHYWWSISHRSFLRENKSFNILTSFQLISKSFVIKLHTWRIGQMVIIKSVLLEWDSRPVDLKNSTTISFTLYQFLFYGITEPKGQHQLDHDVFYWNLLCSFFLHRNSNVTELVILAYGICFC